MNGVFAAILGARLRISIMNGLATDIGEQRKIELRLVPGVELIESLQACPGDGEDHRFGNCYRIGQVMWDIGGRLFAKTIRIDAHPLAGRGGELHSAQMHQV